MVNYCTAYRVNDVQPGVASGLHHLSIYQQFHRGLQKGFDSMKNEPMLDLCS